MLVSWLRAFSLTTPQGRLLEASEIPVPLSFKWLWLRLWLCVCVCLYRWVLGIW